MAIQTKDQAQSKQDSKVDRALNSNKPKKFVPLMQREFRDLVTLEEQLKWVELKKKQKDKEI